MPDTNTIDRERNEAIATFITESIKREQHILDALTSACVPMEPTTANALMKISQKIMSHFCSCGECSDEE